MIDAQRFIFVTERAHEHAGFDTNKIVSLEKHESHSRVAVMCVTNLSEAVVQVTRQWHWQHLRHGRRIRDQNLINRNEESDGVM
ncbi:MAG: hypothetical protein ACREO0_03140 [Pseudoxanthomonas sp.]